MSHTPGPWRVVNDWPEDDPEGIVSESAGVWEFNVYMPATLTGDGTAEADWEDDARLIAAAPELLEALSDLCGDVYLAGEGEITPSQLLDSQAKGLAAIAKATQSPPSPPSSDDRS